MNFLFLSFIELCEQKSFNYEIIVLLILIKNRCYFLKLISRISKKNCNLDKLKKNSLEYLKFYTLMQTIVNSLNKLLPLGKKVKKYLPFFIGFKLLTFTGFLTYIMNR